MQKLGKNQGIRKTNWELRLAAEKDISAIESLIPRSVRALLVAHYSIAQMDAAIGPIFGVDRQLIQDGTYFVAVGRVPSSGGDVESGDSAYIFSNRNQIVGCGGWSQRKAMFGGDRDRVGEDALLDPQHDPARIRAFFIHPAFVRRGIGRSFVLACETAIREAGFKSVELVATLTGEPLYASCGYAVVERYEVPMVDGLKLPVVRMAKPFNFA